jgi:hypothetical protein
MKELIACALCMLRGSQTIESEYSGSNSINPETWFDVGSEEHRARHGLHRSDLTLDCLDMVIRRADLLLDATLAKKLADIFTYKLSSIIGAKSSATFNWLAISIHPANPLSQLGRSFSL